MPSSQYDLIYLEAGLEELETFLLSKKMFWPITAGSPPGEPAFPRLTLGGISLALARLQAQSLDFNQQARLQKIETQLAFSQQKWRVAWGKKVQRAFQSRLRQWGLYIAELSKQPEQHAPFYANEVKIRVMLAAWVAAGFAISEDDLNHLNQIDFALQMIFRPGEFIWATQFAAGFPKKTYWYLWGQPAINQ